MTLKQLKNYYVGQRFIIKWTDSMYGSEIWEFIIEDIEDLPENRIIHCWYRYKESPVHENISGNVEYGIDEFDDIIEDCWYKRNGFEFLGWIPIKPVNQLPEEYFVI